VESIFSKASNANLGRLRTRIYFIQISDQALVQTVERVISY